MSENSKIGLLLLVLMNTSMHRTSDATTINGINFVDVPIVSNRVSENSIYADIINFAKNPTLDIRNRMTCAHETTHMINANLRNKIQKDKKVNAFYLPRGWAVVIEEPSMKKSRVAEFIAPKMRGSRYALYVQGSPSWNNRPLYLVDEWCAYINGAMVGIDDVNNGRYNDGWTDGVSGCLELSMYCVALCMAVEKYDNDYWNNNKQFKLFINWNLQRAYNTYMIGKDYKEFKWKKQEEFLKRFRESDITKPMRDFMIQHFNGIGL